jgi:fumarate reductase subunit D
MMRTRLTKVLALILALVMTIGLLPMSAMAERTVWIITLAITQVLRSGAR